MNRIIITAIGIDRPGLVNKITSIINQNKGNIENSKMIKIDNQFAIIMDFKTIEDIDIIKTELKSIKDLEIYYKSAKPIEIEQVVKELSGIEDVVAFGIHHEIFGQVIKLNVIKTKNSDLDKAQILSHCIKNLEKFKIPSKIDFVEKIPKTDYGKVKRFMLK